MSSIAVRCVRALAFGYLIIGLAGCAGVGDVSGRPPTGSAAEQARLRLTDQCMYEAAKTANMVKDRTSPRCQCYARGAVRQMSPSEVASVAAGGSVPFSVRSQEIMNICATQTNAFTETPSHRRVKKKRPAGDTPASSETSAPSAPPPAEAPPPANAPAPPAGGGDQPKQ